MKIRFTTSQRANKTIFTSTGVEFSATSTGEGAAAKMTIAGLAIPFNQLSDDRGGYFVRISPGAAKFDQQAMGLFGHDPHAVLGNAANGTLRTVEKTDGVHFEIDLPNTQLGRDTFTLVKDKYVSGVSFGCVPEKIQKVFENGQNVQEYQSMLVDEITITPNPSFTQTHVEAAGQGDGDASQQVPAEVQVAYERLRLAAISL